MPTLKKILAVLEPSVLNGKDVDMEQEVTLLTCNSKEVRPGSVFIAVKGVHQDGHTFIADAISRGAILVVAQEGCTIPVKAGREKQLVGLVDDPRAALAELAAVFYGKPADEMVLVGLTGTNGKTTCTWLLEKILAEAGYVPGVIGTVNYRYVKQKETTVLQEAPLTTPDPVTLQKTLRRMADNGVTHVLIEVSSHALDQKRLGSLLFDVAAFTNLSRDHLDYHHDLEEYFAVKKRLFQLHLKTDGAAVIVNRENAEGRNWGARLADALPSLQVYRCGLDSTNDIWPTETVQGKSGTSCTLHVADQEVQVESVLTGEFNILNMLTAGGVSHALGLSCQQVRNGLAALESVPGRMEQVVLNEQHPEQQPAVFVDYAHTPDALDNVLRTVKQLCRGRLVCVFGCGGDRDRGKRPEMGKIVGQWADCIVVTSDNPRTEDPEQIIQDIIPGVQASGAIMVSPEELFERSQDTKSFSVVTDRHKAISFACSQAENKDWVVIAGKGHETYQIVGREKHYFDDRFEALQGLLVWSVKHLLAATKGQIVSGSRKDCYKRVSTDSRKIQPGDIFVALHGEHFDGHNFIEVAVENGAAAVVVDRECGPVNPGVLVIKVADTLVALGALAAYRRRLLGKRLLVASITGSSGKTTVKEMTAAIFAACDGQKQAYGDSVLKTEGNFNNLIGLPLSLLPVTSAHRAAILEMGMNSFGEIAKLTAIADPDIGCINNVQPAHLLGLGTVEGVAAAKGELFAGMRPESTKVVNYDDPHVRRLLKGDQGKKIGFAVTATGRRYKPAVQVTRIFNKGHLGTNFTLDVQGEKKRVSLQVPGNHNVSNAAAAAAIAVAAGIPVADIVTGLESYAAYDKRMVTVTLPGGLQVVNDTYNANPASMAAALQTVASFGEQGKRIAALGDMLELGELAEAAHEQVGRLAAELGYNELAVTGEYATTVSKGALAGGMAESSIHIFADPKAIATWLYHLISNGVVAENDWLLAKGSRGMRMETIIEELEQLLKL
ncbi:UDP-N-acetylmuramoyl-L-alanyl-D-glutamate--2,6-diaminopimelate ligase [Desulfogranum marinum]|uniref:UDP-N-acetylmuramoyl-L-alanyl-D-glutamate--2, 6-diaminopimelate ligase n=1 Tax=Desulfogranum marinum TaxID=453220 RepID=UPI001964E43B|nr:UDP-N-acetylmuramoyl-L-alanyl-D-glutamate--2,6-diaminopimelate ligase [Desulfogranum marinum]MBM9511075.1 UDP-N-acetylmuramoyl-L-alanyl-D-glutamate--2,6-diaminopimelate ligase [Desulfogranum marinum]